MSGLQLQWLREAVMSGDASRVNDLLSEAEGLSKHLDEPLFAFGQTALVAAVDRGHRDVVDVLLDAGADINRQSAWDAGAFGVLHHACFSDPDLAAHLIARGAEIDIWAAAGLGMLDRVRAMLDEDPSLVVAPGPDGQRALHFASTIELVDELLARGADLNAVCVDHESTAAQWQVVRCPAVARYLLDRGADADLFVAAALDHEDALTRVLSEHPHTVGVRLGHEGNNRVQPLNILCWHLGWGLDLMYPFPHQVAAHFGHDGMRRLLDEASSDEVLFKVACLEGQQQTAEALAPKVLILPEDQRMLADAVWGNDIDAVRTMLAVGFDVHAPGDHDSTPLDRAAFHGFAELTQMLLDADDQPPLEVTNEFGGRPIDTLVYGSKHSWREDGDHARTAQLLIDAGSKVNARMAHRAADAVRDVILASSQPLHPLSVAHRDDAQRSCSETLVVRCSAAVERPDQPVPDGGPRAYYFDTTVENLGDTVLAINWFDTFVHRDGRWIPWNIHLGEELHGTADDFARAFGQATLAPGESVVLHDDWRSVWDEQATPLKWAVQAASDDGVLHYAEAIVVFE